MKDIDKLEQCMMEVFVSLVPDNPEVADRIIARCSPERRLHGLAPADRLRGLTPEELERLKRLLH